MCKIISFTSVDVSASTLAGILRTLTSKTAYSLFVTMLIGMIGGYCFPLLATTDLTSSCACSTHLSKQYSAYLRACPHWHIAMIYGSLIALFGMEEKKT